MSETKKTPLYERHRAAGGKIVDYSGWLLPVQYAKGVREEVLAARKRAALFDVSHMGELELKGPGALAGLQRILTNDMSGLIEGSIRYSPACYPGGGVVDDILVYKTGPNLYLLVVNAANRQKDYAWFSKNLEADAALEDKSDAYAQLALQGPAAASILAKLYRGSVTEIGYYRFKDKASVASVSCLVSRTGYTGEDGFEFYCSPQNGPALWDAIMEAGSAEGLEAAGLAARDILRLEAALPLYGQELSADISPLEAGLKRFVAMGKVCSFIGREALAAQEQGGLERKLYGLEMLQRGMPRHGYPVLAGGQEIGAVSSGGHSPALDKFIALALLKPREAEKAEALDVLIRGRAYRAKITSLPFYRRERA